MSYPWATLSHRLVAALAKLPNTWFGSGDKPVSVSVPIHFVFMRTCEGLPWWRSG